MPFTIMSLSKLLESKGIIVGTLVCAIMLLIFWGGWWCLDTWESPDSAVIQIPLKASEEDIKAEILGALGSKHGAEVLMLWKAMGGTTTGAHGRYAIEPGQKAFTTARALKTGRQTPVKLTFNNLRRVEDLAARIGAVLEVDSTASMKALDSLLAAQGYSRSQYPAALVPDTYEFYWTASAPHVVKTLLDHHQQLWAGRRQARADSLGVSPTDISILASIVEEETASAAERPLVARLYLNRLKRGIPLQADPTVKFACGDAGLRRITGQHLAVDSPYNTYRHKGLPPGPIRIPEMATIDAVLWCPEHPYLYMCAKSDFSGRHDFAADFSTHQANARRYRQALDQRNIH